MPYQPEWARIPVYPGAAAGDPAEDAENRLNESAYLRETPASQRTVVRLHASLSNRFCRWLKRRYNIRAEQEKESTDVRFSLAERSYLPELKICYGKNTREAIREAIGQLFEYNLYPPRQACASWLIVLDTMPSATDLQYVSGLRSLYKLPLSVVWSDGEGFSSDEQFLKFTRREW